MKQPKTYNHSYRDKVNNHYKYNIKLDVSSSLQNFTGPGQWSVVNQMISPC